MEMYLSIEIKRGHEHGSQIFYGPHNGVRTQFQNIS